MSMDRKDCFTSRLSEAEVRSMGSLALAHVGDAVFELLVRLHCAAGGGKNGSLHQASVEMVNAAAQAGDMEKLLPLLAEEEADVFRRGRNVKVHSAPKHARLGDYHAATGLEALFGYLYLMGRRERLNALFAAIVEGF